MVHSATSLLLRTGSASLLSDSKFARQSKMPTTSEVLRRELRPSCSCGEANVIGHLASRTENRMNAADFCIFPSQSQDNSGIAIL